MIRVLRTLRAASLVAIPLVCVVACGPTSWNDNVAVTVKNDTRVTVVNYMCWDAGCTNVEKHDPVILRAGQRSDGTIPTAQWTAELFLSISGQVIGCVKSYVAGTYVGPPVVVLASRATRCKPRL